MHEGKRRKSVWAVVGATILVFFANTENFAKWMNGSILRESSDAASDVQAFFDSLPLIGTTAFQNACTILGAVVLVGGATTLACCGISASRQRRSSVEPQSSELPTSPNQKPLKAAPQLRFEHDKDHHITKRSDGLVEVRVFIRNIGEARAKRVRVQIDSLVPLGKKRADAAVFSTQFGGLPLQVVRKDRGFDLHPGEPAEIILIRTLGGDDHLYVDGYCIDGSPSAFKFLKVKHRITLVATTLDGGGATAIFEVNPTKRGLAFKNVSLVAQPESAPSNSDSIVQA
jgi:hypothetical protein